MEKNVLVTGAAGFVGCAICKVLLDSGHNVTGLTRDVQRLQASIPGVNALKCDLLTDEVNQISFDEFDVVIHAAGEVLDESLMQVLHVASTAKILKNIRNKPIHWIQVSSVGVYGPVDSGEINTESPYNPKGIYETSKLESDEIVKNWASENGISLTVLQPSNVFSKYMTNDSLRSLVRAIQSKKFFYIGSGKKALVTLVHVETVADSVLRCVENQESIGQTYILSDSISLRDFVGVVHEKFNMSPLVMTVPIFIARALALISFVVPAFPLTNSRVDALTRSTVYDGSKIARDLGVKYCNLRTKIAELCRD